MFRHLDQPSRSMAPVRWYGGKGNMLNFILPHMAGTETVYVEPYCGAASVLWAKAPHSVEVVNDLDGDLVNLFRVLQDRAQFREFAHRVCWTLYSLDEFRKALATLKDTAATPLDRAWAFYVAKNQGFSGKSETEGDWSRAFVSNRGMARTTCGWRGRMKRLRFWHDRLTRVQIDSRDALEVICYWDSPSTLFYLDPPYVADTRAVGTIDVYSHEASDNHHAKLVETILEVKGRVVLSGYAHPIYQPLSDAGWERLDLKTACHAAGKGRGSKLRGNGSAMQHAPRTETLWLNRRGEGTESLFAWSKGEEE